MSRSSRNATDDRALKDVSGASREEANFQKRYTTRAQEPIPVRDDDEAEEEAVEPDMSDTDRQIERDEYDAMDTSNVMKGRTRHAKPQYTYQEEPQSHYQTMVDR